MVHRHAGPDTKWTIDFPEDYAKRREAETPDKGWLDVSVRFADGRCYALSFYDPVRLRQTIDDVLAKDECFCAIPGLVVVDEVNTDSVIAAVAKLVSSGQIFEMPLKSWISSCR